MCYRILHVTRSRFPSYGGVETTVKTLVRTLPFRSYILAATDSCGCLLAGEEVLGNDAQEPSISRFLVTTFADLLKKLRISIIHLHNMQIPAEPGLYEGMMQVAEQYSIPVVLTAYDVHTSIASSEEIGRLLLKNPPSRLVTVSQYSRALLPNKLSQSACVIRGPVDFRKPLLPSNRARSGLVIAPARLVPRKGIAEHSPSISTC